MSCELCLMMQSDTNCKDLTCPECVAKLRAEVERLKEIKVGVPRLMEAVASSPGAEERKTLVDEIARLNDSLNEANVALQDANLSNRGGQMIDPNFTVKQGEAMDAALSENAKLRASVEALKVEIGGRSRITEHLQFQYESALLQLSEAMLALEIALPGMVHAFSGHVMVSRSSSWTDAGNAGL